MTSFESIILEPNRFDLMTSSTGFRFRTRCVVIWPHGADGDATDYPEVANMEAEAVEFVRPSGARIMRQGTDQTRE